jgi:predicted dienelactone hydrolase
MHTGYHARIGAAAKIPTNSPKPVISFSPVVISAENRPVPLELRVTVPSTGNSLPVIVFSHGLGTSNSLSSLEGYTPLVEFWAAHGFAVLQPTHLNSTFLGLQAPEGNELFWQEGYHDVVRLLDNLDTIEAAVPRLHGRLDRRRIAVAGHSGGALTVTLLLGASNQDPRNGSVWQKSEARIKAGIILAAAGNGGHDNLSEAGLSLVPFYGPDFSTMALPALVVYGDNDIIPHLTTREADWHADPFTFAPGPKDLLILKGGHHGLGGVSGWDAGETLDESPERLGVVQRMTWAYLQSQLYEGDSAWEDACEAFTRIEGQGKVERK